MKTVVSRELIYVKTGNHLKLYKVRLSEAKATNYWNNPHIEAREEPVIRGKGSSELESTRVSLPLDGLDELKRVYRE